VAASNLLQEPALVLHVRPYRESSSIVQFLTRGQGRVVGVMKGLKRDNPKRVALQAFSFGSVAFIPREGLVTVRDFDLSHFIALKGDGLYAGFYILELLSRLVPERQSEPLIFSAALKVLESLEEGDELEPSLRNFEMDLLHHLGFGLDFRRVAAGSIDTAKAIEPLTKVLFWCPVSMLEKVVCPEIWANCSGAKKFWPLLPEILMILPYVVRQKNCCVMRWHQYWVTDR
jgi:DNA repair protein RecO